MKKYIIDKIEKLELKNKDTDLVLLTFDCNQFNVDEAYDVFKQLEDKLPGYTIGCIPKGMEIEVKDIDSMIKYLEDMKK